LPITPFNLVCTNVPGPQYPLYMLGHKMLQWYPYVPVGGEMAVNCAILSYNGRLYFGFSGDVHAAPDLRRLEDLLGASFTELRDAAGVHPPRRKKRARAKAQVKSRPAPVTVRIPISVPVSRPSAETAGEQRSTTEEHKVPTQLVA